MAEKNHKRIIDDLYDFIMRFQGKSGIIYCGTKKDCEQVAEKLRTNHGVSIKHYHAALTPNQRMTVQKEWQTGKVQVIAATIAFGMGIDKPDVRFVIHYSIPSSVEGYYQETGRAGRDGLTATCRLYYNHGDTCTQQFLIDQGEGDYNQKQRLRANLNTMVKYYYNTSDCRRKQIMSYFGENFKSADCHRMCDNCRDHQYADRYTKDFTKEAGVFVGLLEHIQDNITFAQLVDVFKGSRMKRILERGYDGLQGYGAGALMNKQDIERLLNKLIAEDVIKLTSKMNAMGFASSYLEVYRKREKEKCLICY